MKEASEPEALHWFPIEPRVCVKFQMKPKPWPQKNEDVFTMFLEARSFLLCHCSGYCFLFSPIFRPAFIFYEDAALREHVEDNRSLLHRLKETGSLQPLTVWLMTTRGLLAQSVTPHTRGVLVIAGLLWERSNRVRSDINSHRKSGGSICPSVTREDGSQHCKAGPIIFMVSSRRGQKLLAAFVYSLWHRRGLRKWDFTVINGQCLLKQEKGRDSRREDNTERHNSRGRRRLTDAQMNSSSRKSINLLQCHHGYFLIIFKSSHRIFTVNNPMHN